MTALDVMMVLVKVAVVGVLVLLGRVVVWAGKTFVWTPLVDPLRKMSGLEGSLFQSHLGVVMNPDTTAEKTNKWVEKYGRTFRFNGFGRHDYRMISYDPRVVSHVLNSSTYEKPWQTRTLLTKWFGGGLFSAEGPEHRWQRKLIGPAFTVPAVRSMTPIFFQKADELKSHWNSLISRNIDDDDIAVCAEEKDSPESSGAYAVINVAHWMSRAMLDVVGLVGFGYQFESLRGESEELYLAYRRMFDVLERDLDLRSVLQLYIPLLERFWPNKNSREVSECQRVIRETGKSLVDDKRAMILAQKSNAAGDITDRDILSLLIKSNLSANPCQRLSDSELLDQISTFLFAGADSTALAIAYCLHFLALYPEVQTRLREELASTPTKHDTPSPEPVGTQLPQSRAYDATRRADSLDQLAFLDSVVRETLRMCPPVHSTIRVPTKDDLIPVLHPVKMRDGTVIPTGGHIPIRKGTYVHIPIAGLNVCEEIWGKDAKEFNPDRWSSLTPGLANIMTFSSGPHSCIGVKFSFAEIKVFVATLVQHFVFEPEKRIAKFSAVLTRPYVAGKYSMGSTLPLKVRRYVE